ncbi:MAG: helix-turn-helix transcriptional regulator [Bacteroidaceae bacterium]|nr:helix-turn-helix transcriptional regulator [Bacteroidaceae bacterium]
MTDNYTSPEELRDEVFIILCKSIYEADSTEERVTLLDEFFLRRLAQFPEGDINIERLCHVFDDMVPTDGSAARPPHCRNEFSPADLASTACLSQKQFTRVFNKYVGMNPKSYLRLLRFHKALMEIQSSSDSSSLTNIAWSCGYYDLAHMTSDFRDICGFSPSELIRHGQELTEAFGQKFTGLMKKKIKIENLI